MMSVASKNNCSIRSGKARVLLVDDHPIIREGIKLLLNAEPDLIVCGEYGILQEALSAAESLKPDLVLADMLLEIGAGLELIRDFKCRFPRLPVVVLTMHEDAFFAERTLRAGARGFLSKNDSPANMIEGCRTVLSGRPYVSHSIAQAMACNMLDKNGSAMGQTVGRLSDRELEVFELIGQGLNTHEMAARLHVSVNTIESHCEHIRQKMDLPDAKTLARRALEWLKFEEISVDRPKKEKSVKTLKS
jgi:DNA-binding NarL/FixJ family response regulator